MEFKKLAQDLLEQAAQRFDDAEIYTSESKERKLEYRNGEIDEIEISENSGLQILASKDGRWAQAYSECPETEACERLLDRIEECLDLTEPDSSKRLYKGELDQTRSAGDAPASVDVRKTSALPEFSIEEMIEACKETERKLRDELGQDHLLKTLSLQLIRSSGSAGIVNPHINARQRSFACAMLSVYLVVEREGAMESGFAGEVLNKLDPVQLCQFCRKAYDQAVDKLDALPVSSGRYKVYFDPETTAQLLEAFESAFSADSVQKGLSFLKDKIGTKIASDVFTLSDEPTHPESPVSMTFDGEGVPTSKRLLIEEGVLRNYFHNLETAARDDKNNTALPGNAQRSYKGKSYPGASFLVLKPGERREHEILTQAGEVLHVYALTGLHSGLDSVSGDFSLPAYAYLYRDGKRVQAVNQITIAGNLVELLRNVRELSSEPKLVGLSTYVPGMLVEGIAVSGS